MAKSKTSADKIVNIGAGAAAALILAYLGISYRFFSPEEPKGCMSEYRQALRFGYENNDGSPLSLIELQGLAGFDERGVMENVRIDGNGGSAARKVLQVSPGRSSSSSSKSRSAIGMQFSWRPDGGERAQSSCLRYSVKLPADFEFGSGGVLPGVFGGLAPDRAGLANEESLSVRPQWSKNGNVSFVALANPVASKGTLVLNRGKNNKFPLNRWVTVEQEVVLNAPGKKNGSVRVWLDGEKVVDATKLVLRADDAIGLDGVAAAVAFSGKDDEVPRTEARVSLTPIDYGWR